MSSAPETHSSGLLKLPVHLLSEYESELRENDKKLSESHKSGATISFNSHSYQQIFGTRFAEQGSLPWKKGIVKIISKNGKTIYRLFQGGGIKGGVCLLDDVSMRMLGIESNEKITLKAAPRFIGRFLFYWQHPNEGARVSFKSGVFYCIISTILSVIGFLK